MPRSVEHQRGVASRAAGVAGLHHVESAIAKVQRRAAGQADDVRGVEHLDAHPHAGGRPAGLTA